MKPYKSTLGEDIVGSIAIRLKCLRLDCDVVEIRLHPLDAPLSQWPYGWPPVEIDNTVSRQQVIFMTREKDAQLSLGI